MDSVKVIYFSPTGTTRRILDGIAEGLEVGTVEYIDLTFTPARRPQTIDGGLTLIGVPVYAGRVPVQAAEALAMMKAHGTPAVLVVVYGNRAFDDALLDLKRITEDVGFKPFAAAAFIGEHSFSTSAMPIAAGRPDNGDLVKARAFGRSLRTVLEKGMVPRETAILDVPGNSPLRDRHSLDVCPESDDELCVRCGTCEEVCPEGVITVTPEVIVTDRGRCIHACCACIKACPTGARKIADPKVLGFVQKLAGMCRERKEPEFFFSESPT
jgi:ferredoxin